MNEIRIFISYATEDRQQVREIYRRLLDAGYHPWLDVEEILPGQNWDSVIKKALATSPFVIICLSKTSIEKRSYYQREIKHALERLQEMLDEDIYLIPARLELCEVPESLKLRQWVDLFEESGWQRLLKALDHGKRRPDIMAKQAASQAHQSPPAPPQRQKSGLSLQTFEFTTVTLDERGKSIERRNGKARQYVEELGSGVVLEMVEVPGGEFEMGSPPGQGSGADGPSHRVKVPPFFMGKFQITQAQWRMVAGWPKVNSDLSPDPSHFNGNDLPVEQVSWHDAIEFCARLASNTGRAYRLPSEAKWEYACRAGTTKPFAFGETITSEIVNYNGNYPYGNAPKGVDRGRTTPVGSLGVANSFGFYDLHGNIWEWCQDVWHNDYRGAPTDGSTWTTDGDQHSHVLRGGSWLNYSVNCRSAYRSNDHPDTRSLYSGFRVVVGARTS